MISRFTQGPNLRLVAGACYVLPESHSCRARTDLLFARCTCLLSYRSHTNLRDNVFRGSKIPYTTRLARSLARSADCERRSGLDYRLARFVDASRVMRDLSLFFFFPFFLSFYSQTQDRRRDFQERQNPRNPRAMNALDKSRLSISPRARYRGRIIPRAL